MKTKAIVAATAATAAPIDGLTRDQAARFLRVSERQIQRLASAGQIRKKVLPKAPGEKAAPVVYSRRDLEAVKRGENAAKPDNLVSGSKAQTIVNKAGAAVHLIAAPALPPWLSIPDASKFSGLPRAFLRARAADLERIGAAVNVATGSRAHWRLLRSALEKEFPV
jgi:hypothetical protein